jgi:glycosyltransferase involved in cell wall biosynthesis
VRVAIEMIAAGSVIEEGAGGGAAYYHGIMPFLAADPRLEELVILAPRWYERAAEFEGLPGARVVRCDVPTKRPLRVGYEQFVLPRVARREGVDVLFSTGNLRPLLYRGPNVVGLHAIQYFLLGWDTGGLRAAYLKFTVPRALRSADLTVAVTETLRGDAIDLFGLDPERVVAVHMGPPAFAAELREQAAEAPAPYRLDDGSPYILCISRLYALKNHRRLIQAYARLTKRREVPHRLVIVGGDADVTREELAQVAHDAGVGERVIFLGRVPQSQVVPLYLGSSAIAYVSLYETFGHPVLEAFATGTPLLTSAKGATGEVAGDGAVLADPESEEDIAAGLDKVLFDEPLRERLVEAGRRRIADFSWESCARGTVDALERALELRRTRGRPRQRS